ncbi:MAG: aldehyde dehydrogenase family protein [Lysobacterales bacterium]
MRSFEHCYIDGEWVTPTGGRALPRTCPVSEAPSGQVLLASAADVDRAVGAARRAFAEMSGASREQRLQWLRRLSALYAERKADLCAAVVAELGCPMWLAEQAQVPLPGTHIDVAIDVLERYEFDLIHGSTLIRKQPIGVCGLITPWNWPVSLAITKLVPALAAGCSVVWKPSEFAPCSAQVLGEIWAELGLPKGAFNLLLGEGREVGGALSSHPDVDQISITGSTRAGVDVARQAAASVKRVHQELGGKSPNVVLDGADLAKVVESGVRYMFINSGQTCSAPSRMIVPRARLDEVLAIAMAVAESIEVGPPESGAFLGPLVNAAQWGRVQDYIASGIAEGARVVVGGPGRPEGLTQGYYVRPTIFADVTSQMRIVREEIFGPVLCIQTHEGVEDAVALANDTPYGLAAFVHAASLSEAREVAVRLQAGQVCLNGDMDLLDPYAPFGGRRQSGNGREWGAFGLESFLEEVAYLGYQPDTAEA